MNRAIYILAVLLFSLQLFAKPVIVSDIDDTIKISHVRSKIDQGLRAFLISPLFKGMPLTYQYLTCELQTQIYYVTNAPGWLMGSSHSEFLNLHNFPSGMVFFRKSLTDTEHKYNSISEIIRQENPKQMILIGDDGEADAHIYHQIQQDYPQIEFRIYIRSVYETFNNLPDGMKLFRIPAEIILDLAKIDWIEPSSALVPIDQILADVRDHFRFREGFGPLYLTTWMNEEKFVESWKYVAYEKDQLSTKVADSSSRALSRCAY